MLLKKVLKLKPDNPKYCVSMAEIMYNLENLLEAIQHMEKALKLRPSNTNYLLSIA
ncbi:MAG: tetratricopeptide repeat protein [Patescibacteria group bacterium]